MDGIHTRAAHSVDHICMIIGYNEKTDEIIYSDSWGAGHAKKSMDAGKAFSMTQCILVMPPKN